MASAVQPLLLPSGELTLSLITVDPTNQLPTFTLDSSEYNFLTGPSTPEIRVDDVIPYRFSVTDGPVVTAFPQWPDTDPPEVFPRAHFGESYVVDLSGSTDLPKDDAVILPIHYPSDKLVEPFNWSEPWQSLVRSLSAWRTNLAYRGQPPWDSPANYDQPLMKADPTCQRRWRLAGTLPRYTHCSLGDIDVTDSPLIVPVATLQSSLTFLDKDGDSMVDVFLSTMLPAAYGMPHLLGWNATFPTHAEQLLWRIAALAVSVSGWVVFIFGMLLVSLDDAFELCYSGTIVGDVTTAVVRKMLIPTVLMSYIAASGYLLVESVRQLFALPPGAFQLPSWANSIPHFT